ncbi:PepSY-like domain-containing protein [Methylocaldum sp.]|uniref:PepSY-like domain-containing protein n=1 Tax=Methylocaldum sp. TaxID=1969727 RepID=UPI002D2BE9E8|nr:PepSY-like domain-containing protein [Methylocaldum sp.]HYE36578.1 PepSY-like domain-containing protein [Methylocaldum sp.]
MKRSILIAAVIGAVVLESGMAVAKEKPLNKSKVPQAVFTAFQKAHPNAKNIKYEEETVDGEAAYEIDFTDDGQKIDEVYRADGTLVETERTIKTSELPEPVMQTVKQRYPKAKVDEVFEVSNTDGKVIGYEVQIKEGKREREVELDLNGNIQESDVKPKQR